MLKDTKRSVSKRPDECRVLKGLIILWARPYIISTGGKFVPIY